MAHFIRHLILLCCGVALVQAQSAPGIGAAPKPVQFQFSVFARSELSGLMFLPQKGREAKELRFYTSSRSPTYTYRGEPTIYFYEKSASVETPGSAPQPVAVFNVPPTLKRGLLLFFPKSVVGADGLKYEVYGMDDAVERIPGGHFVIVNASMATYAGAIGAQPVTVPRGVSGPFSGNAGADVRLWRADKPNNPPVITENWSIEDRQRVVVFLFPPHSPTGRTPIIRRLGDTLPEEKPVKPAPQVASAGR